MGKSTHFIGQPLFSQVINLIGREKIRRISQELGGERYVKRFDCWTRLTVMLYAVIMRFDSLREIAASMQAEARKLCHLGIRMMPSRSTLVSKVDIIAMDRAYMDYGKLEEITRIGAFYVTKMKKGLKYEILEDTMWQTPEGLAEVR